MNKILLFLTVAILSCNAPSNKTIEPKKESQKDTVISLPDTPIFHIRVKTFTGCWYKIVFTNDDFITEQEINDAFDISKMSDNGVHVVEQMAVFTDKNEAIALARRLKTYNDCLVYNARVHKRYEKLLAYRIKNPETPYPSYKEEKCENIDILIK